MREIIFRGSVDEAIDLLGVQSYDLQHLIEHLQAPMGRSPTEVFGSHRAQPWRQPEPAEGQFRRLRNLIKLLAAVGQRKPEGDMGRLVDRYLAHLATKPAEPPARERPSPFDNQYFFGQRIEEVDVNHGLAWLVEMMDEPDVVRCYGERLLALQEQAQGRWKDEIQLAIQQKQVDTGVEVAQALARAKPLQPVRSPRFFPPRPLGTSTIRSIAWRSRRTEKG